MTSKDPWKALRDSSGGVTRGAATHVPASKENPPRAFPESRNADRALLAPIYRFLSQPRPRDGRSSFARSIMAIELAEQRRSRSR